MEKQIVAIMVDNRSSSALCLQELLTQNGCMIKTRLGIHDGVADRCSQTGLIILETCGEKEEVADFVKKINGLKQVKVKSIFLNL